MPKINEYRSRTEVPGAMSGRRAATEDVADNRGLMNLGAAATDVGDMIQKRREQSEISELNADMAKAQADWTTDLNGRIQRGDLNVEKFDSEYDEYMGKFREKISTRAGQLYFEKASSDLKGHFSKTAAAGQAHLAGVKARSNYETTRDSLSSSLIEAPDSFDFSVIRHNEAIDNLVKTGGLPADDGEKLKQDGSSRLAASAVSGWAKLDPEYAKEQLKSGRWNAYLGGEEKIRLMGQADQEIRAREIEEERRRKEAERIKQEQQQVTQNDFLGKMTKNQLTTKDILNSNLEAFGSGSKQQFLNMLEQDAKSGGAIKTDPGTMIALFDRINAPDNDPKKLRDENELNRYFGRGLSKDDLNYLRAEVQGKRTQDGSIESDLKRGVMDMARGQLTKSNPLLGRRDPEGDEQLQKYMVFFLKEYSEQRKQGKSTTELLSPDSPTFLGKYIKNFTRTPMDIQKSMIKSMRKPENIEPLPDSTKARKEGESASDYLKRMGQ